MSEPDSKPLEYESRVKPTAPPSDGADYACPKCDGDMIAGYCISQSQSVEQQLLWAKGIPTPAKIFGLALPTLDTRNVQLFPVTTYACNRCGYLESFLR